MCPRWTQPWGDLALPILHSQRPLQDLVLEITLFYLNPLTPYFQDMALSPDLDFPISAAFSEPQCFVLGFFFFLTFNFFFSLSSFIPLSFHVLFAADNQTSGVFPVLNHRPGFQLLTRGFGCSASLLAHQGLLASLYLILVSTVFS